MDYQLETAMVGGVLHRCTDPSDWQGVLACQNLQLPAADRCRKPLSCCALGCGLHVAAGEERRALLRCLTAPPHPLSPPVAG